MLWSNKVNKTASGKATGGLVQQGFCDSGGETAKFNGSSSVQLLYKIEDLCFDCPTIAKPRNVRCNFTKPTVDKENSTKMLQDKNKFHIFGQKLSE